MENVKECDWVDLGSSGCPECRDRMVEERSGECDYCGSYWFPWEVAKVLRNAGITVLAKHYIEEQEEDKD